MKALEKKKEYPETSYMGSGESQSSNLADVRSHLKRILKKLVLLKMLKSQNRRIKWLCDLAHKYRKLLALGGPLEVSPASSCTDIVTQDPQKPNADIAAEPATDIEEIAIDKEPKPHTSSEIYPREPPSSELYEALCLKGLPQRLHMPAPKVLCRPSTLRVIKPCCTRSCSETLERIFTIHYSKFQTSQSIF